MRDARQRSCLACEDEHVELDEAVTLLLEIRFNASARAEPLTDVRNREIPDSARYVDPWPERHVVGQRPVAEAQHDPRMDETFAGVKGVCFPHVAQISVDIFGGRMERYDAERGAGRERPLIRRRPHFRRNPRLVTVWVRGC